MPGDGAGPAGSRDRAVQELQYETGGPVTLETGDTGDSRVLATTPGFSVLAHTGDPVVAARQFWVAHHEVFQLDAGDAEQFEVTRVDHDRAGDLHHVTLQRVHDGIPVFQGAVTIHMDRHNAVFRVLDDESYHISPPTNRIALDPVEAIEAAGSALHLSLAPVLAESHDGHAVFTSSDAVDPIHVDPTIFHLGPGNDRFAFQTTVSWLDEDKQLQYELALIDAETGLLLASYSLVNTCGGLVFTRSPGASPREDLRSFATFPSSWCPQVRVIPEPPVFCPTCSPPPNATYDNNVISSTDLNGDNLIGNNEIMPSSNANGDFNFSFSPLQDAAGFRAAAVTSAYYLANVWHDRTYTLGFTESAGNFQLNNFGRGGAQNDPALQDIQDGAGLNNANFATPPDGMRPRRWCTPRNTRAASTGASVAPTDTPAEEGVARPNGSRTNRARHGSRTPRRNRTLRRNRTP